jgi:hypothetical protein
MEDHSTVRYAESARRKGERQELAEWVFIGTLAALDVIRPSRGKAVVQTPGDSRAFNRGAAKSRKPRSLTGKIR